MPKASPPIGSVADAGSWQGADFFQAGGPWPDSGPWHDAVLAATVFSLDPSGLGGIAVRARPGAARERWLGLLRERLGPGLTLRRLPAQVTDDRLLGGLDLSATLQAGRPIAERGILADCDGGVVLAAMAERLSAGTAARLAAVLDEGAVHVERDGFGLRLSARIGIVALDEGSAPEEAAPVALIDRLAFRICLDDLHLKLLKPYAVSAAQLAAARALLPGVASGDEDIEALVVTAARLGIASPRAPLLALRAARALAALAGRRLVGEADLSMAARLVLAPRATLLPVDEPPGESRPQEDLADRNEQNDQGDHDGPQDLDDPEDPDAGQPPADAQHDSSEQELQRQGDDLAQMLIEAAAAAIPAGLLAQLSARQLAGGLRSSGASGQAKLSHRRGRPVGVRPGAPGGGARLALLDTLRAAAPWQRLRALERPGMRRGPLLVRREDLRIKRYEERSETTTIFAVDASGSSALNRMAEAKGAIELLLADCYVRRDQVALIAFRGQSAEVLLPPTRSLARAKRSLAGLPGGGATPLAAGIDAAALLADALRRRGQTPVLVLLTDGRANIRRDGQPGRLEAADEALQAGRRLALLGLAAVLIDTSPRPQPAAAALADAMGARYVPMPYADAAGLSLAVKAVAQGR
jgi:magnesium chelatase subunit D